MTVRDVRTEPTNVDADQNDRLSELEVAEGKRVQSQRLDRRFELLEAVILSFAAVLAAWAGFQAAKWSGVQADSYSRAGATRVESTRSSTKAGQQQTVDVVSFTQWLQAAQQEGLLDVPAEVGSPYVPDPNRLSGFLYERFRPEFKVAVDAWAATSPRVNADAPPTPFAMPEYQLAASVEAQRLEEEAQDQAGSAREANQRADEYVLMTIMFATVLFFAGISSKMVTFRARTLLLGVATTLLLSAIVIVVSFPKQI